MKLDFLKFRFDWVTSIINEKTDITHLSKIATRPDYELALRKERRLEEMLGKSKLEEIKLKERNFEKLITIHKSDEVDINSPASGSPMVDSFPFNHDFFLEKPRAASPMGSVGSEGERPSSQQVFVMRFGDPKFFDEIRQRWKEG